MQTSLRSLLGPKKTPVAAIYTIIRVKESNQEARMPCRLHYEVCRDQKTPVDATYTNIRAKGPNQGAQKRCRLHYEVSRGPKNAR